MNKEPLPNEAIKEMNESMEFAKKQLETTGSFYTMFHATQSDGKRMVIMTPWGNEAEKKNTLSALRIMFFLNSVTSYVMVSETWYKQMDEEEMKAHRASGKFIEDYPDKEEAIVVNYADTKGRRGCKMAIMKRENGKIVGFTERDNPSEFSGRMFDLLDVRLPAIPEAVKKELAIAWEKLAKEMKI